MVKPGKNGPVGTARYLTISKTAQKIPPTNGPKSADTNIPGISEMPIRINSPISIDATNFKATASAAKMPQNAMVYIFLNSIAD